MNKTEMLYKADTGQRTTTKIRSLKVSTLSGGRLTAIDIDDFPKQYVKDNDLLLHTPEYVSWLE